MGWGLIPSYRQERDSFGSGIGKIWKSVNDIWDQLNVEHKNHDVRQDQVDISAVTPAFYDLTDIDAGISGGAVGSIDVGYRDGDKIRMKSVHVKGSVFQDFTNTYTNQVNIWVVKHFGNMLGDSVSFNELFDALTGQYTTCRLRNKQYRAQYRVLASRVITLGKGSTGAEDLRQPFDIFIPFRSKKNSYVEWEGTQGTNPSNGKIYLVVATDTSGSSANPPEIYFASRVTYIDN